MGRVSYSTRFANRRKMKKNLNICKCPPCYSSVIKHCIVACVLPIAVSAAYMVLECLDITSKDTLKAFSFILYLCFALMGLSSSYAIYRSLESVKKMIVRILLCLVLVSVFLVIYYIVWAGFMMFFAVCLSNIFGVPPFVQ